MVKCAVLYNTGVISTEDCLSTRQSDANVRESWRYSAIHRIMSGGSVLEDIETESESRPIYLRVEYCRCFVKFHPVRK